MLKILQARLQHYMHGELPDVQVGFRKAEEPEIKVPTLVASWRKHRNSRKTSTSASLRLLKPLTVWITTNCGKFLKRWEYQTTLSVSWETCMWVKKQNQTWKYWLVQNWERSISSVQFSCSVVSNSLRPHESQHTRPPCPSPTHRVYSNSCPSSRWCHPAISCSAVPFSSCPQSLPASESFPMS